MPMRWINIVVCFGVVTKHSSGNTWSKVQDNPIKTCCHIIKNILPKTANSVEGYLGYKLCPKSGLTFPAVEPVLFIF